jgi:hypothetical protein
MQPRQTLLAKGLACAGAIAALASAALGAWPAAGLFAGALLALEFFLGHQLYRLTHAFCDVVASAFQPLPVVALRADAEPSR